MKNNSLLFAILTIAISSSLSLHAQNLSIRHIAPNSISRTAVRGDGPNNPTQGGGSLSSDDGEPFQALSAAVIAGANTMPVGGILSEQQTDGRATHNIQVDPSNSQNVHAVIMEELGTNYKDSTTLYNRRLLYTFSSNGGQSWSNPDTIGTTRDGFACMILYKNQSGQYVPIIAAHQYLSNAASSLIQSVIWIEQGSPGTGNFARDTCGTNAATLGSGQDLLWPYIGVSPDSRTIYIISSYDPPASNASAVSYIQFGTFTIGESGNATFNGWSQEIGDTDQNDGNAGYDEAGDYVLRVSPSGKIGILWRETDYATPAINLYFIESTDGGQNWTPDNFGPLPIGTDGTTISQQDLNFANGNNEVYSGPWAGMDFFYAGENAKIVWTSMIQTFPVVNGNEYENSYFPSQVAVHFYDNATSSDVGIVSNIAQESIAGGDTTMVLDTIQYSLYDSIAAPYPIAAHINTTLYGPIAPFPVGSYIKESDDWIAYPTIAQSTDPNVFSVYYQTFPAADSVKSDTSTYLYASIYSQTTTDGGMTWSAPTPFVYNNGPANTYGKIDYRWPSVSDWNPLSGGVPNTTAMFGADTAAGTNDAPHAKGATGVFDVANSPVYFYEKRLSTDGVTASAVSSEAIPTSSYPNPFAAYTTINFTLPTESNVLLTVTDVLGRSVATLVNERLGAGEHSSVFSPQNLADGVYRYTLQADGVSISGSMSLVR